MKRFLPAVTAFLSVAIVIGVPLASAATQPQVNLGPGDSLRVTCTTRLTGNVGARQANLTCAPNSSSPTATPTPTTTPPTPTPTAIPDAPTPTPTPDGGGGGVPGQLCPASVHDRYAVTGPDGRMYRTWHPPVDPQSGCLFGHEHGDDPRRSQAANDLPAFGYAAATMGMDEPHVGFKVFVMNNGDNVQSNEGGNTANHDVRFVYHMGTAGVARYSQQFHSFQLDYIDHTGSGREAHLTGMTDTGATGLNGSTCDNPRRGAKDFADLSCHDTPYEIWNFTRFQILYPGEGTGVDQSRFGMSPSFAAFDPITTRDPSDNNRLVYTQNVRNPGGAPPTSPDSDYQGCNREFYSGPYYWNNAGRQTVYFTDAMGHVAPNGPDAQHPIRQRLSAGTNGTRTQIFKPTSVNCGNGIRPPN